MKCCGKFLIYDHHSGIDYCDICGYFTTHFVKLESNEEFFEFPIGSDFIETVCVNNHICKSLEQEALYIFKKRSTRTMGFAAYCIYYACKKQQVGRTLTEISTMCSVPISEIIKYEEDCTIELLPSHLVARFCAYLNIRDFNIEKQIAKFSDLLYSKLLLSSPPQSVVALAIYVVLMEKYANLDITLTDIATTCGISVSCIKRLFKIYKKEILELLSLSSRAKTCADIVTFFR